MIDPLRKLTGLDPQGNLSREQFQAALGHRYSRGAIYERLISQWNGGGYAIGAASSIAPENYGQAVRTTGYQAGISAGRQMSVASNLTRGLRGWRGAAAAGGNIIGAGIIGGASAILPIEPPIPGATSSKAGSFLSKYIGKNAGKALGMAGKGAFAAIGPIITGYRLYNEGIGQAHRVLSEEIGGSAGFAIGASIGSAVPVVGTIAGGMIGAMVGQAMGTVFADTIEVPFRAANTVYKHLRAKGIASRRLELGGQMSAGNRTMYAQTMRQRALMQMNRSGLNARNLLGNEAQMLSMRAF